MTANRMNGFWGADSNAASGPAPPAPSRGFMANPFASSIPAWQMEIYRAAFLQAQKDMEKDLDGFPWAESGN